MKKKAKYSLVLLRITCISLMALILGACNVRTNKSSVNIESPLPTPVIAPIANQIFIDKISPVDELNSGITIERLNAVQINGLPTPSPNYISVLVLNHTDESVIFNDIGFDIQVFEYSPELATWKRLTLRYWPEKSQKALPPKLEKFDFNILNSWELLDGDIVNATSNSLRIYVFGQGEITSKIYGAYLDLALQQ